MSRENVELIRRVYESWNEGDAGAVLDLLDPAIELHDPPELPGAGTHHGREAVEEAIGQLFETWEWFRAEPEELIDADDQVVVIVRLHGRGRASGLELDATLAQVFTMREGRVVRLEMPADWEQALKAVGLAE